MRRYGLLTAVVATLGLAAVCRCQPPVPPPTTTAEVNWPVVIDRLAADVEAAQKAANAPRDVVDSNLPLAQLELEKMRQRQRATVQEVRWGVQQEASQHLIQQCLARLREGRLGHQGETGAETELGYVTRAYRCRTDGSPQPYYLRLPKGYTPDRPWPLVIFLHGYVPETCKAEPWVLPARQWAMAAERGVIMAMPHGRRNSDFLGIGEVDTLRVIEELRRWYRIDPDRILLTGCSMGGYGGWAIGLRQPDWFAGLALMSGQSDFFTWERRDRGEVGFKSWCILQNNPLDLVPNAQHLPVLLQHGALDPLVPVVHSRLIVPEVQRLRYAIEYHEYANQGHYLYWEDEYVRRILDWCVKQKRVAAPARVRFRTFTPRQGRAYWVDVRGLHKWGPPADVTAVAEPSEVRVQCTNVSELWLDLPASLVGTGRPLKVNQQALGTVTPGPRRVRIGADGRPQPLEAATPPADRPRTGPAREVFNQPFRLVWASGGDAARVAYNQGEAERLRQVWWDFCEGWPPLSADRDLTAEQVREHNLVIFGEPDAVTLAGIAEPAKILPEGIKMAPQVYTVGQHTYQGANLGMILLAPHPLHAQRLILWLSGRRYGEQLPVNHQFDLLPDLLVYDDQFSWDATNRHRVGGFLSPDWRLDEARLDYAKPAP